MVPSLKPITAAMAALLLLALPATAQLPADAVDLAKVKIAETVKPADIDPVTLENVGEDAESWEWNGTAYRGSADSKTAFLAKPEQYTTAHSEKLWEENFILSMSRVWCPVTDQLNPGGLLEWEALGLMWESCCTFCNEAVMDEDFPAALDRLKERAKIAYEKTGGVYVNDASSPVEGAIRDMSAEADDADTDCALLPAALKGQQLEATYNGGIGLIFEHRCLPCHRTGGLSPINFETIAGIRQWSKNMKTAITTPTMPPWPAQSGYTCYSDAMVLTPAEKDLLVTWIDNRFPMGEGDYTPPPAPEWNIGEPDLVVTVPEYLVPEDAVEHLATLAIDTELDEDRWVVASEVRPEDPFLVVAALGGALGTYLPGNPSEILPDGMARRLQAGDAAKVRLHYVKEAGWDAVDMTQFAVKFAKDPASIQWEVRDQRIAHDDLEIPAGEAAYESSARFILPADWKIVSVLPNLRERGKSVKVSATLPDGTSKVLVNVPHWKHKWRLRYTLAEPFAAPRGTAIQVDAVYDNSAMNVDNPNPETTVTEPAEVLEVYLGYGVAVAD